MKKNKVVSFLFLISLIVLGGSFLWAKSIECSYMENSVEISNTSCYNFADKVISPIFISFATLLVMSLILIFVKQEVFSAWRKFAVFAFPIMVILLLYFFNNEPTYGLDLFGQDEEFMSFILPILFIGISLLIIGVKSWKLKQGDNKKVLS